MAALTQQRLTASSRRCVVVVDDEPRGELVFSSRSTVDAPLRVIERLKKRMPLKLDIPLLQRLCSGAECSGVIVVRDHENRDFVFAGALTGATVYWTWDQTGNLLVASSSEQLARLTQASVDRQAMALSLADPIPAAAAQLFSLRDGIHTVSPLDILINDGTGEISTIPGWRPKHLDLSAAEIFDALRDRLLRLISDWAGLGRRMMVDVSGGVDSAMNAYILKALRGKFEIFHARSDSGWNSDTEWARRISKDLSCRLCLSERLGLTSFSFNATEPYSNGVLLDQPILWSDSEGYMNDLDHCHGEELRCHLMGLGGDELFTPMPSQAWSMVREAKFSAPVLLYRYSSRQNIPWRQSSRSLFSVMSFDRALKRAFRFAGEGTPRQDPQSWIGSILVPEFLSNTGRALISEAFFKLGQEHFVPWHSDRSRHQAMESLLRQAQVIDQLNRVYKPRGILSVSPFLDPEVVELALSLPVRLRAVNGINKYPLYMAMRGIMPAAIFTRRVKGEYSSSAFYSFERQKDELLDQLQSGSVASLDLVDVGRLRDLLDLPLISSDLLDSVERLAGIERWANNAI